MCNNRSMKEKIDLHTHTIFSDGWKAPCALLKRAQKEGISIIAITDHDSIDAYKSLELFKPKLENRIIVIPGIEFTSCVNDQEDLHILGYGIDYKNSGIKDIQIYVRQKQLIRKNIFNNILYDFSLSHIADVLDKRDNNSYGLKNYNFYDMLKIYKVKEETISAIKAKYKGAIKFLDSIDTDAPQIIDVIHGAKGYAFFAHPGHYKWSNQAIFDTARKLKSYDIDGIEVYHPRNNYERQLMLSAFCDANSLYKSAGSDYHGSPFHDSDKKLGGINLTTNESIDSLPIINKILDEGKGMEF